MSAQASRARELATPGVQDVMLQADAELRLYSCNAIPQYVTACLIMHSARRASPEAHLPQRHGSATARGAWHKLHAKSSKGERAILMTSMCTPCA